MWFLKVGSIWVLGSRYQINETFKSSGTSIHILKSTYHMTLNAGGSLRISTTWKPGLCCKFENRALYSVVSRCECLKSPGQWKCYLLSHVWLFKTPWTRAHQASPSVGRIYLGKDTGVGSHSILQEIFPNQGLNAGLLHCRQEMVILHHQNHLEDLLKPTLLSHSFRFCKSWVGPDNLHF